MRTLICMLRLPACRSPNPSNFAWAGFVALTSALENQVAGVNVVSKVEERPRTRRAETMRIYQTPPDKYPTIEWYSEAGFLWSVNCSSTERRTVDNPPRADVNVDAMVHRSSVSAPSTDLLCAVFTIEQIYSCPVYHPRISTGTRSCLPR